MFRVHLDQAGSGGLGGIYVCHPLPRLVGLPICMQFPFLSIRVVSDSSVCNVSFIWYPKWFIAKIVFLFHFTL